MTALPASPPPSVLLIDDSADTREMYACALALEGYRVRQAADVNDALAAVTNSPPDVIVTDWTLTGLGGLHLLTQLRRNPPPSAIPVIVLSGWDDPSVANRAFAGGATAFLLKPCMPETIASVIRQACGEPLMQP